MDKDKLVRRLHLGRATLWAAMIPISMYFGFAESIMFITFLSLWALVEGALSAYNAELAKEEAKNSKKE